MYDANYPTIFVVADSEYIPYLQYFLFSLTKNTSHAQVFVHFINTPQSTIQQIQKRFPVVKNYGHESIPLNSKNTNIAHPTFPPFRQSNKMFVNSEIKKFGKLYSDKVAYCANIRALRIVNFLKETKQDIIYTDIDNIVNKDLEPLYGQINEHDILVVPELSEFISTTFFYAKNNPRIVQFFESMSKDISADIYTWGIDNVSFNKLLENDNVKSKLLPAKYCDETHKSDSVIWINHLTMYGMTDKYQEVIDEIHFCSDSML